MKQLFAKFLVFVLQELPGCEDLTKAKVDAWFKEIASDTRKVYEDTEGLKATLKAKGFW